MQSIFFETMFQVIAMTPLMWLAVERWAFRFWLVICLMWLCKLAVY